ncbi:tyrosine-type recombinase/integrase [Rhodococcus sp. JVH1]|uniref:tyrosine-type recombinase/integrase n=1 Tax=Rhodococcus sp. JVH1 TaxID=745408 RepID=UPI00192C2CF9|nr:tyrosine-type recombinase/integrase [Rhodococcus sp. JVH1]
MVRAITLTWLFAGQRSDEIARLRLGCIRWQHDQPAVGDDPQQTDSSVCLLDIPTHKTGTAFTKPVDPLLGRAIEAWQALRPAQPPMLDRKTGEKVHFLFAVRAGRISKNYINDTIIPALCRKADIPSADVRGPITSHRARSTIATQLCNAKEPMTLFELQAWLGHRSPESTQHYAKSPRTPWPRHTTTPATSPATSEPSKSSLTATRPPPALPPLVSLGSTTTSATGSAATPSSSNARTAWPAPAATSTFPKSPAKANSCRRKRIFSGCSSASRSPTMNKQPSKTVKPPSTSYCNASPTFRPRPEQHHAN